MSTFILDIKEMTRFINGLKDFKFEKIFITIIIGIFFLYIFVRAKNMSITYDEAYTYKNFINTSWLNIFTYYAGSPTNNHLINSILSKISIDLLGNSELSIRLPNVLSFIPFGYSLFYFFRKYTNFVISVLGMLLIILNPFILDFFSLSRGYGLALSFFSISLLFFIKLWDSTGNKKGFISLFACFSLLSILSNLVFANLVLPLYLTLFIKSFINLQGTLKVKLKSWFKFNFLSLIYFVVSMGLFGLISIYLKLKDQLYYGGTNNFISDSIQSVIKASLYSNWDESIVGFLLVLILVLVLIGFVLFLFKKSNFILNIGIFLLGFSALSTTLQFYLLGNRYLIDRTALFLILLFNFIIVGILISLVGMANRRDIKYFVYVFFVFYFVLNLLNFTKSLNLEYTYSFKSDSISKEVANKITDLYVGQKVYISSSLSSATGYYLKNIVSKENQKIYDKSERFLTKGIYYLLGRDYSNLDLSKNTIIYKNEDFKVILFQSN